MNDSSLQQDIIDELDFEPSVNAAHIGVVAENGIVTLSGHVGSYIEKFAAERAVRRVKGVQALAGKIEVRFPGDKKTADDEIAKRALSLLHWHALLPEQAITIKVQDGWVSLGGQVQWQYQRALAEASIRRLSGVAGIVNGIVLKPDVTVEDIKSRIENALKRNAGIEAHRVRVSVFGNNCVTLEGRVRDWRERDAIENAAWSAPGVMHIDDRMQIA